MSTKIKTYYPFLLSISGSGRNAGKTFFACNLIERISERQPVAAIKISPHFHAVDYENYLAKVERKFIIYRENSSGRNKDSSRMLNAGAENVFYIQSKRNCVEEAFVRCLDFIPVNTPVICENGGLSDHVKPGMKFFIMDQEGQKLPGKNAEQIIIKKTDILKDSMKVDWESGRWIKNDNDDFI